MTFPTVGKIAAWEPSAKECTGWETLFPSLDVEAQCRMALAWIQANPGKRKTARGMPRFIVGWLLKAERDRTAGSTPQPAMTLPVYDSNWRDECKAMKHDPPCGARGMHLRKVDLEHYKRADR